MPCIMAQSQCVLSRIIVIYPVLPVDILLLEVSPQEKIGYLRRECKRHVQLTKECPMGLRVGKDACHSIHSCILHTQPPQMHDVLRWTSPRALLRSPPRARDELRYECHVSAVSANSLGALHS